MPVLFLDRVPLRWSTSEYAGRCEFERLGSKMPDSAIGDEGTVWLCARGSKNVEMLIWVCRVLWRVRLADDGVLVCGVPVLLLSWRENPRALRGWVLDAGLLLPLLVLVLTVMALRSGERMGTAGTLLGISGATDGNGSGDPCGDDPGACGTGPLAESLPKSSICIGWVGFTGEVGVECIGECPPAKRWVRESAEPAVDQSLAC